MNNKLNLCIKHISCANVQLDRQPSYDLEKKNSQEHSGGKKWIYILQVKYMPIIRLLNKITSYKRHLDREKK